jgi:LmbE family N-acetylglucosaminyl deacetylase
MRARARHGILAAVAVVATLGALPHTQAAEPEPGGDDAYRFLAGRSLEIEVDLVAGTAGVGWTWTRPATDWDTALVGVRLSGPSQAEPWLELSAGASRLRQYLDPGAHGLRWLNLTGLREQLAEGVPVQLEAHGVTIPPGTARLRLFRNRIELGGPILVLAPHPDDAEIAAFGLYAGRNASIVTVTAGNAGDFNYRDQVSDPAEHYRLKGYLRAVDSVTVPWQGGIPPERCFNLGYPDARLAEMRERPQAPVAEMYGPNQDVLPYRRANIGHLLPIASRTATWAHLVEDLGEVLRRVQPRLVVMPHPFLDTHPDHKFVAVAAVEALARWTSPVTFLLYANHAGGDRYPFGPAGTEVSLPPWAGPELLVEGVYSLPVSPDLQRRQLFALESMHDLRLSPSEQSSCLPPGAAPARDDYPRLPAVDYFRRAPRPQEVFFVFGRDGVRDLVRAFLAQRSEEPTP